MNEAMITGESKPVSKEPGDGVIGGTVNGDGSLRVRIAATGDETTLAGIMRLVEEAQQSKSRTQMLADRAAGWLFYVAVAAAAVTAVARTVAISFNAEVVERVVTVLVIACPHALGLAIPLVVAINAQFLRRVDLELPSLPGVSASGRPQPANWSSATVRLCIGPCGGTNAINAGQKLVRAVMDSASVFSSRFLSELRPISESKHEFAQTRTHRCRGHC